MKVARKISSGIIKASRWANRVWLYPRVRFSDSQMSRSGYFISDCHSLDLDFLDETFAFLDRLVVEREETTPALQGYEFRKSCLLNDDIYAEDSLLLRFSLQKKLLDQVQAYLPFKPYLRCLELWVDTPDESLEAQSTQLFHLDGDDMYNVKVFFYLTDVGIENGPFTFMPLQNVNSLSVPKPKGINRTSRVLDEVLLRYGSPVYATGKRGSVIFADTCMGFHKGLKPKQGRRVMFALQYTSNRPWYPAVISLPSEPQMIDPAFKDSVLAVPASPERPAQSIAY